MRRFRRGERPPDSDRLQPKLSAFGNVLGMLRQTFDSDQARVLAWLRHPQPALGGTAPLEAMLRPRTAPAVEQWLTRMSGRGKEQLHCAVSLKESFWQMGTNWGAVGAERSANPPSRDEALSTQSGAYCTKSCRRQLCAVFVGDAS